MFKLPHSSMTVDHIVLRAARMSVQHHPSIPPVRVPSTEPSTTGRFISTRMVRNIALEAR